MIYVTQPSRNLSPKLVPERPIVNTKAEKMRARNKPPHEIAMTYQEREKFREERRIKEIASVT